MKQTNRFPKLFVTDLDGTALGESHTPYARFPESMTRLLDSLVRNGCAWATNTTWDVKPQVQLVHASGLASRPDYLIGGAGLQLCSMKGDQLVRLQPYSDKMDALLEQSVRTELYPLIREVCAVFHAKSLSFNGFWLAITVKEEETRELMRFLEEKTSISKELTIVRVPEENRFYAHPAFLKKGAGLRAILEMTGLTPDDVVAAGDERMDLDMLRPDLAKHLICPANAHPEVKRRVLEMDGVVGELEYGRGVAEAFRKLAEKRGWNFLPETHRQLTDAIKRD